MFSWPLCHQLTLLASPKAAKIPANLDSLWLGVRKIANLEQEDQVELMSMIFNDIQCHFANEVKPNGCPTPSKKC